MASLPPPLSSILFLTLALFLMSALPAFSSSRKSLDDHHGQLIKAGFKATLTSIDSGRNFTTFERLHRQMKRGRSRLEKFCGIRSTVYPAQGEVVMNLSIGTPPLPYYAIMDTGSDLIWTQCKPCLHCFPQSTPLFDPKNSSSYSKVACSSNFCKDLPISNCRCNGCDYLYKYGDGSFTAGVLATETFIFGEVSVPNIGFGCGELNSGNGVQDSAGLVGLGRGPLSLISQLDEPTFSYCLTSFLGTKPSTLLMGSQASSLNCPSSSGETKTTPLIRNPADPGSYYLSLEGITVGSTKLPINSTTFAIQPNGTGGLIIDSGTSVTHLEDTAFSLVEKEFISQLKLPIIKNEYDSSGLLCFQLPSSSVSVDIPSLVFHFQDADLDLPRENYMITDRNTGVMCLAMTDSRGLGLTIFGNIQQQNFLVVHDLTKETVSFLRTECDQC
ncbi:hypothetical protein Vadar_019814 [Vaccinium darrowii]|uniref:Uncharacterized protein n=1 Tax=Vaccinium darrowii TaxID=229202 RepID=A0ACB7Z6H5_9ERIC|nr:hypothetical protein Vadar_019814 [Vaccinium darrowii]